MGLSPALPISLAFRPPAHLQSKDPFPLPEVPSLIRKEMTYIRKLGEQLLQQVLAGCWNKLTPSGRAVPTQGRKWGLERESGGPANKMSCLKSHSLVALEARPAPSPHGPFCPSSRDRDTRGKGRPHRDPGPPSTGFAGRTRIGGWG